MRRIPQDTVYVSGFCSISIADDVGLPCKATNCHLAARSCQSGAMPLLIVLIAPARCSSRSHSSCCRPLNKSKEIAFNVYLLEIKIKSIPWQCHPGNRTRQELARTWTWTCCSSISVSGHSCGLSIWIWCIVLLSDQSLFKWHARNCHKQVTQSTLDRTNTSKLIKLQISLKQLHCSLTHGQLGAHRSLCTV